MGRRRIVVNMWTGARTVRRLGPSDPDPTQADLDEIAVAWTARNGGVKPVVRILQDATIRTRRLAA